MIDITDDLYVDGPPDSDGDLCLNVKCSDGDVIHFYLDKQDIEKLLSLYDE